MSKVFGHKEQTMAETMAAQVMLYLTTVEQRDRLQADKSRLRDRYRQRGQTIKRLNDRLQMQKIVLEAMEGLITEKLGKDALIQMSIDHLRNAVEDEIAPQQNGNPENDWKRPELGLPGSGGLASRVGGAGTIHPALHGKIG